MRKLIAICTTLLLALVVVSGVFACSEKIALAWEGIWYRNTHNNYANVEITNITSKTFDFKIAASSGGNSSGLGGTATIIEDNKAVYSDPYYPGNIYTFELKDDTVEIIYDQTNTGGWAMSVHPNGVYGKTPPDDEYDNVFSNAEVLTLEQEQEFKKLTGDNYKTFATNLQMVSEVDDLDRLDAKVIITWVRGLNGYCNSIIMVRASDNAIWAATINADDDVIYYFTNANTKDIPKTIHNWAEEFKYKIIWKR